MYQAGLRSATDVEVLRSATQSMEEASDCQDSCKDI